VETTRRMLVLKVSPQTTMADLTADEARSLGEAAAGASADDLIYLLRMFTEAQAEMRRSPHPRVELEIATVRVTRRPEPQTLDLLITKVEDALARFRTAPAAGPGTTAPARPTVVQETLLAAPPAPAATPRASAPASEPKAERPGAPAQVAADPRGDDLAGAWARVVGEIMSKKALLGSVLEHATPLGLAEGVLTLAVGGNHFHRELLSDRANRELVNQVVQQHVSGARRIEIDVSSSGEGGARNHPAVQAALSVFQGEVVAVRQRAPEGGEPQ